MFYYVLLINRYAVQRTWYALAQLKNYALRDAAVQEKGCFFRFVNLCDISWHMLEFTDVENKFDTYIPIHRPFQPYCLP